MYNQLVFDFDDDDNDPRYSIRPQVGEDAAKDKTLALIDPKLAEQSDIVLDSQGFPTVDSLEAWHRKHNPQIFKD